MKTYVVKPGDTLSLIAGREYGNIMLWPALAQANPQISNPDVIQPGQVINIPDTIDVDAQVIDSKRGPGTFEKVFPWLLLVLAAGGIGLKVYHDKKKKRNA